MIDLHIHLIPGVDDGPETLKEAVCMCRMARAEGCTALVATPHQRRSWLNQDRHQLDKRLGELRAAVAGEGLALFLGAEIRVGSELLGELEQENHAGLLPLADSRYLLIEFHPLAADHEHWIHELVVSGWIPVVAHPELTVGLGGDLALMGRLVGLGATTQVTAMSVCGGFGARPRRTALDLLDAGLVHFLASDAHSASWRPPGLRAAYGEIATRWGAGFADEITRGNPGAVLENRALRDVHSVR